jgi:hypothetical protein
MKLEGSCHCGAVRFRVESDTVYPYMRCYCSICRKTAGSGGYGINIKAGTATLRVTGKKHVRRYQPWIDFPERSERSEGVRHFCGICGSPLWVHDKRWAQWIYPHASAIDTPLPVPPEVNHILLDSKASWVEVPKGTKHRRFAEYPDESIQDWHERMGLVERKR